MSEQAVCVSFQSLRARFMRLLHDAGTVAFLSTVEPNLVEPWETSLEARLLLPLKCIVWVF
jgi:hypothetical protein